MSTDADQAEELTQLRNKLNECSDWLYRLGVASLVLSVLLAANCSAELAGADDAQSRRVLYALTGVLIFGLMPAFFFVIGRGEKLHKRFVELQRKGAGSP